MLPNREAFNGKLQGKDKCEISGSLLSCVSKFLKWSRGGFHLDVQGVIRKYPQTFFERYQSVIVDRRLLIRARIF